MSRATLLNLLAVALFILATPPAVHAQQHRLRASVFGAGGTISANSSYTLRSTLGQSTLGRLSGTDFVLDGGFWNQVPPVGFVVLPAAATDNAVTDEDTPVTVDVLANDTDPAGGTLTLTGFSQPSNGTVEQAGESTLTYTPVADFNGEDGFTYTVTNEQGGSAQGVVAVTINAVNDAPVFTSKPVTAAVAGHPYSYTAEVVDVDGDGLMITAPTQPPWLTLTSRGDGKATLAGTPSNAEAGKHDVVLGASDGIVTTEQSFTITVVLGAPAVPTLITPEDLAVVVAASVALAWDAVPGAASYGLQVATRNDFSELVVDETERADTTFTVTDLTGNTAYFWRVRAVNSAGASEYATPFGFMTAVNVAVDEEVGVPGQFVLMQNYPNPFNPTTTIAYTLPQAASVRLSVYDLYGREVATLVAGVQAPGRYEETFDASALASGIYFYRIEAGAFRQTRQLILLK